MFEFPTPNLWSGTLSKNQILKQFASLDEQRQAVFDFGGGEFLKTDGMVNLTALKNHVTIVCES